MVYEKCFSCEIKHPKVECIGIWYCPNALCRGVGAAWFRSTLDSYKEIDGIHHEVCKIEWLEKGRKYNIDHKIKRKNFKIERKII